MLFLRVELRETIPVLVQAQVHFALEEAHVSQRMAAVALAALSACCPLREMSTAVQTHWFV